ncbi:MAG TPA: ATP-dependent DNA helicase RecG [Candidatus Deferrimicrobiaceae bacterium]|nr:ATP-dependent DNA helicase RecG [Candidatus Deferrimicrobiaceae bacterium]
MAPTKPAGSPSGGAASPVPHPLATPLQFLKGVGPQRAKLLANLGLHTVEDTLYYLPVRHEDRSQLTPLRSLKPDEVTTVSGTIRAVSPPPRGRPRVPLSVLLSDGTGYLTCVWFGQAYLERLFQRGQRLIVHGKAQRYRAGPLQMHVKDYEIVEDEAGEAAGEPSDETLHTGRLVPIYGLTRGLTARPMRRLMKRLVDAHVDDLDDPLPDALRARHRLPPLPEALRAGHFPKAESDYAAARRRLVYDEFLLLQLGLAIRRQRQGRQPGLAMNPPGALARRLLATLPFALTAAQERVWREIRLDMAEPYPMNRLLQGDVGSGKTVVAALAILTAVESGYQAALMAPTEILAEQHLMTLTQLLEPLDVRVALLTNAVKGKARERVLAAAAAGEIGCVVGTHALVQENVKFHRLGLAVVDEQHRFGVHQRATLRRKGESPDVLVMTATPIPRTLALTLYGDLEVSVIDELPPGREPVVTRARPASARGKIYRFLREQVADGRQVYVVCPLVEESEALDLQAATEMAERLQREVFPDLSIGLLHGRMPFAEKDRVMREFKAGAIHVLVSTTVIEVGIDVPNASVMLVEHAERFGLSQLHQLRGRVGRGPWKSYCILLSGASSEDAKRRLQAMTATNDGFKIAEADLALRGPGDFFGTRQSGLPEFRVADLLRDAAALEAARRDAVALIREDPNLLAPPHRALRAALLLRWRGKLDLAGVG